MYAKCKDGKNTYYYAPVVTKEYMCSMLEDNKISRSLLNSLDKCKVKVKRTKVSSGKSINEAPGGKVERSISTSNLMKIPPLCTEEQVRATTPQERTN